MPRCSPPVIMTVGREKSISCYCQDNILSAQALGPLGRAPLRIVDIFERPGLIPRVRPDCLRPFPFLLDERQRPLTFFPSTPDAGPGLLASFQGDPVLSVKLARFWGRFVCYGGS